MRAQVDGRVLWLEGLLAPTPAARIEKLTSAIEFHAASGRRFMLPALLDDRARAYRAAGDDLHANADVDAGIAELETSRESLPRNEKRWGVFHTSTDLFDDAVDLALARGDAGAAFRQSEHARARTLLDSLKAAPSVAFEAIPAGTALVEFAVSDSRIVVFVVDRSGVRLATYPANRLALSADIETLQKALLDGDPRRANAASRSLYTSLLQPVAAWVQPYSTLVVIPDATVSAVPFAALVEPDGHYVAEQHAVVIAPSASVFLHANSLQRTPSVPQLLIVVNDKPSGYTPLGQANEEARMVAHLYRRVTTLEGREATASAFSREAQRADLIHFTGHALASDVRAEDTSLVLAGSTGQQRFDVKQIAAMKLERSPIVILAACSTARGQVTPQEGTMSVAHAFLAAGASSVVATLWPIDDHEATDFFERVHRHLARGETPAEAVRAAQLESIHSSASPAMWAAVQVIGS
jgi:CHAT domain-containing protein